MGVQDVVARLNKSKSATTVAAVPLIPKRKITTKVENKVSLPSPASSPTGLNNKSIANMLQKFGQPPTYPSHPITTPTSPPGSPVISLKQTAPAVIKKAEQPEPQPQAEQPEPQPKTHTQAQPPSQPQPQLQPQLQPQPQPQPQLQPQPQPHLQLQSPPPPPPHNRIDIAANEIEVLFQTLLDQNKASEEYIEKLKMEVEKYSSDATKVRDYEIRVEYLALKLEQVSEERDSLEKELNEIQMNNNTNKQREIAESPMSPAYSYQHDIVIEDEKILQNENNDAYMEDILNVYEEISENGSDEMQLFDQQSQQQECDKGIQMTIVKYVTDLETQKLETKALKQVVKKQDELIMKLETKIRNESTDELLKEQVQVQRIELDNKRELLSQLLNEREDLLKRLHKRSCSIDSLDQRPNSYSSISSGRGTPPLTAPPRQPLPPLPMK